MRVIFTCISGQSHFYSTAPLAFAARDLGHEVAFSSALELAPIVERAGLTLLPAGPGRLRLRAEMTRSGGGAEVPSLEDWTGGAELFGRVAPALRLRPLSDVVERYRPDAIVSETLELAGPLVALKHGIPHYSLSIGPYHSDTMEQLWAQAGPLYREHMGTRVSLEQAIGCYVDVVPPELQTREGLQLPDRLLARCRPYHGQGGPLPQEEDSPGWNPRVLVTFGTVFNKAIGGLHESVARLSRRGMDVLMTAGPDGWFDWSTASDAACGRPPDRDGTVRIVDYIPLNHELPRSSVVIHHGGSNTMRAAVDAAVPSLMIPQEAEQLRNALWAVRHGLGLLLKPAEVDPSRVERDVMRLLKDRTFADRLASAQAAFPAMPSATAAIHEMVRRCGSARPEDGCKR